MAAFIALGLVAAAGVGAAGASAGAKKAEKGRQKALKDSYARLGSLNQQAMSGSFMGGYGTEEIFGSVPEAALYEPVDLTQSQLDTIAGNLKALPSAAELSDKTNDEILKQDLKRIRALVPNYDTNINRLGDVSRDLLLGRLPYGDVLDITSNRSELAASVGVPGGSAKATLRDLGVSQLQATQSGASLFQQMMGIAEAVNPQQSRMRPQQMYFNPLDRAQLDIEQATLQQQSEQNANNLAAMPDPAAAALFNQQSYLATSQLGMGGDYGGAAEAAKYQAVSQAIGGAVSLYAGGGFGSRTSGVTNNGFGYNQYTNPAYYGSQVPAPAGGVRSVAAQPAGYASYYTRPTGTAYI